MSYLHPHFFAYFACFAIPILSLYLHLHPFRVFWIFSVVKRILYLFASAFFRVFRGSHLPVFASFPCILDFFRG